MARRNVKPDRRHPRRRDPAVLRGESKRRGERKKTSASQRRRTVAFIEDIGRITSCPFDLDQVLGEGAEVVRRLIGVAHCSVFLHDATRRELRLGATAGEPILDDRDKRLPMSGRSLPVTVVRERRPTTKGNVDDHPGVAGESRSPLRARSMAAAPLVLRDEPIGVLLVSDSRRRIFTIRDIARMTIVAAQLAVAVDNFRLHKEAQRRLSDVAAIGAMARVVSSSLGLDRVLEAGAEHLMQTLGAAGCSILLADSPDGRFRCAVVRGEPTESLRSRLESASLLRDAIEKQIPAAGRIGAEGLENGVVRDVAALVVPLWAREQSLGVALITDRERERIFTDAEIARAMAITSQLAVAVENARLYDDLRKSYADLGLAQAQLVQRERLAALGELAAVVAHEVRNPLGAIFNSIGALRRLLQLEGDAKALFAALEEEADRLNQIVGDLLEYGRPPAPKMHPEPLSRVLEEAAAAALGQDVQGIELACDIDPRLPPVPMDARLLRHALLNVAVNAVQAMQRGGKLTIRAQRDGDSARVEIADTGTGISEETQKKVFEPFFTTKASGTGLGLAIAKRIVEVHRGEISLASEPGVGTTFFIRLPIEEPRARVCVDLPTRSCECPRDGL